jgi:predicted TIM-barrel fold metal-dependent hydrolase
MQQSRVIDSDTHVDETEATWDFMPAGDEDFKPVRGADAGTGRGYWLIDGYKVQRAIRKDSAGWTTVETRELLDVGRRLRHMDELGVEVHVIYPTIFNRNPTDRPEVELSLTRSYNRWMAERTASTGGRLRWICVPPLRSMNEALAELRFARDHGACGVLKKGDLEADHEVYNPYFFPLYEEAERLDMPICFHQGTGRIVYASDRQALNQPDLLDMKFPTINGISSLIAYGVPSQFPKLRFGCIEVSAAWLPLVDHMLRRRVVDRAEPGSQPDVSFEGNRVYVTCEVDEDFPMLLRYISEDNLLVGSDYTHNDPSREKDFIIKLQEQADRGTISQTVVQKILWDNPRAFYSL